jgi:hypothetical protein
MMEKEHHFQVIYAVMISIRPVILVIFCFCTRYMTSCHWSMLAHPALLSFVPGGTRLARLNARLNAAHL